MMTAKNKAAKNNGEPTLPVEEGPYYKTGSQARTNTIEPGTPGKKLIVEGYVLDRKGHPVVGAWLDFWHADGNGEYDNKGYNLRGHQYTDKNGRYRLETVRPKEYLFRAAHIHVKVRANDRSPILTTQLFFPGEAKNSTDPIFNEATLMNVAEMQDGQKATFDFVVDTD
jgi:protocatechuate 3,4-dioxygenase beta subunit